MPTDAAGHEAQPQIPTKLLRAAGAALGTALVLAPLFQAQRFGLPGAIVATSSLHSQHWAYALAIATAAILPLVASSRRRLVLGLAALLAYPIVLGPYGVGLFALVTLILWVARRPWRLAWQLALVGAAWLLLPVARALWFSEASLTRTHAVAAVWASLAYSAVLLLVERRRFGAANRPTLIDDWVYLTLLPRLTHVFYQPISPRYLLGVEQPRLHVRLLLRGVALGAYGVVLLWAATQAHQALATVQAPVLRFALRLLAYYAGFAHSIFISMALVRLLGFDVGSGFRYPFASTSFADFFRRWNYYVRDAVLSVFYLPFVALLRHHLPARVTTTLAAYLAIFVGSFLMNDLLIPLATSPNTIQAFLLATDPFRLAALFLLWSAIILPSRKLWLRSETVVPSGWMRWWHNARFLIAYFGLWLCVYLVKRWLS